MSKNNKTLSVGLTGTIGSGKSTVGKVFETLGIPIYEADEIAKSFYGLSEVKNKIIRIFGADIYENEESIDRRKLASVVFSDSEKLQLLENVVHPLVRHHYLNWLQRNENSPYGIHISAVLFKKTFYNLFDKTIVVVADEDKRLQRVLKRDQVSEVHIKNRMKNQMSGQEMVQQSDSIIHNNDSDLIIPQVLRIHHELLQLV